MKRLAGMLVALLFLAGGVACAGMGMSAHPLEGSAGAVAMDHNKDGIEHWNMGHWDVAKMHFELAVKSDPEFAEGHYNLGLALDKLGDHKGATEHFKHAYEKGKNNSAIQNSSILKRHLGIEEKPMGY